MEAKDNRNGRVRKAVNELVMAEMFLLQATIESATAIGDGINQLGKEIAANDDQHDSWGTISTLLQRTADEALEPYTSRYKYFRKMIDSDS